MRDLDRLAGPCPPRLATRDVPDLVLKPMMAVMGFDIVAASGDRFEDVRTILGPKRPGAQGCWCLPVRLGHREEAGIRGEARAELVRSLCQRDGHAPGVLAYDGPQVVGWAGVAPREELVEFTRLTRYPRPDDDGQWVIWCLRVRAGHARRGIASALVDGAATYAQRQGASSVIGFPIDNEGATVDRTLASVGVRTMFERAGFSVVAPIRGRRAGCRQVLVRKDV